MEIIYYDPAFLLSGETGSNLCKGETRQTRSKLFPFFLSLLQFLFCTTELYWPTTAE
jgi:hypothetical protein